MWLCGSMQMFNANQLENEAGTQLAKPVAWEGPCEGGRWAGQLLHSIDRKRFHSLVGKQRRSAGQSLLLTKLREACEGGRFFGKTLPECCSRNEGLRAKTPFVCFCSRPSRGLIPEVTTGLLHFFGFFYPGRGRISGHSSGRAILSRFKGN